MFFKELLPKQYEQYERTIAELETKLQQRRAVDGYSVMEALHIAPGEQVGQALEYIHEHYPDATELTDEMVIILRRELGVEWTSILNTLYFLFMDWVLTKSILIK